MRKKVFGVVLAMVLVLSLGAVMLDAKTTTIRIAFWGGQPDNDLNTKAAKLFESKNPDIKIKIEYIPSDYDTKMMTMIAGGNAPDVIQVAESLWMYAQKGSLTPLDSYIKKDKFDTSVYFPSVLSAYRYNKAQYGLPHRWGPMILYYNKDLFDKAGVKYPTNNWTWDDFLAAAQKLTTGEGNNKVYGYASVQTWWPWYLYPIMQFGSPILNEERTAAVFDMPKAAKALQFLWDLQNKYHVAPTPAEFGGFTGMGPDQLFETGRVAMNATGFWAIEGLRKVKNLNWDVAWLPKGEKNITPQFGACWSLTSGSKNKAKAWRVLKFYAGKEYETLLAKAGHDIPAIKSIAYSSDFLNPGLKPEHMQLVLDSADHCVYPPVSANWNVMQDVFNRIIDKYYRQQIPTAEEALKQIAEGIKKEFK